MKIITSYIGKSLLGYTAIAIAVLTFVMVSAQLFRAFDMLARGLPLLTIGRFILYLIPYMLQFTAPLAMLCATVLVFSRLSADNEITAMRASGISLWQIIAPAVVLGAALTAGCLYLQLQVSPEYNYRARQMREGEAAMSSPLAFLEPGRHVEFPGYIIYVGDRSQETISSVQIYEVGNAGNLVRDITARHGQVRIDRESEKIEMTLEDAMVTDMEGREQPLHIPMRKITFPLAYAQELNQERLGRSIKRMDLPTLFSHIHIYNERNMKTTPLFIELHNRLAMGLSPLAFLLIGVPFGIRTRRTETSIGLLISVSLAMFFYVFVVFSQSLESYPQYRPELMVWLPNIVYQAGGLLALRRIEKR